MRGLTLSFKEVGLLVLCLGKGGGFLKAVGATSVLLHPRTGMEGTWFGLLWFRRGEGRFLNRVVKSKSLLRGKSLKV